MTPGTLVYGLLSWQEWDDNFPTMGTGVILSVNGQLRVVALDHACSASALYSELFDPSEWFLSEKEAWKSGMSKAGEVADRYTKIAEEMKIRMEKLK